MPILGSSENNVVLRAGRASVLRVGTKDMWGHVTSITITVMGVVGLGEREAG